MTDLDEQLRAFLEDARAEKSKGISLASIHDAQKRLADAHTAHEQKCELRWQANADVHSSTHARLQTVEARVADLKDKEEDTGSHIIQLASDVGEAKGLARGKSKDSLPPLVRMAAKVGTVIGGKLAERTTLHIVLVAVGIGLAWAARLVKLVP